MGTTACCSSSTQEGDEKPPDARIVGFLANVELFKRLPANLHPALASCSTRVEFCPGDKIIKQGDDGTEFFVIMQGQAGVQVDGVAVANLGCGDYFGENALLRNEPRTATIMASTAISALRITQQQFQRLGLQEKLEFPKRGAVGGGVGKEVVIKPPGKKTNEEMKLIAEAIRSNVNLSAVVDLTATQIDKLIGTAWKEDVPAGTKLIKQDELEADYFYIVQEGAFDVIVAGEVKSMEKVATSAASASRGSTSGPMGQGGAPGTIGPGGSFGELALLYFAPRAATVQAKVKSVVWVIARTHFKQTLSAASDEKVLKHVGYLRQVEVLKPLKDDERMEVAKALTESTFQKGESVMQQGETGDTFYILTAGEVTVAKQGKEATTVKATAEKPQFFGENALMKGETRAATIKVVSQFATSLTLDRESFNMVLGPLSAIKQRGSNGQSQVGYMSEQNNIEVAGRSFGEIERKDLKVLGLLGCGGFGAVELVEHTKSGNMYALKSLSKGYVVKSGMQGSVLSEKKVQILCDSAFVIKLFETYNGDQTLYFLLELALGGELYATYHRKSFFGKEPHAKFYVAGVILAFDHMHSRKIVFRDLKPENILLNDAGQVKLTDMGLAKVIVGKTFTTCGTPDYFAPELIQSTGHTRALDWWTLGILCFELLAGRTPFEAASPMLIYNKVVKGINRVHFPTKMRGEPEDLIKGLCKADPSERLPMRKGGIENLQQHGFYQDFAWEDMRNMRAEPPYLPAVKNKKDIANFSARKEDMPPQVPYKDNGSGWDAEFATGV